MPVILAYVKPSFPRGVPQSIVITPIQLLIEKEGWREGLYASPARRLFLPGVSISPATFHG